MVRVVMYERFTYFLLNNHWYTTPLFIIGFPVWFVWTFFLVLNEVDKTW